MITAYVFEKVLVHCLLVLFDVKIQSMSVLTSAMIRIGRMLYSAWEIRAFKFSLVIKKGIPLATPSERQK